MISKREAVVAPPIERQSILVLMDNKNNATLVEQALQEHHDVTLTLAEDPAYFDAVDLVIVDGVSLHRYGPALARVREHQRPLYLPVLLLTDRDEPYLLSRGLQSVVDEMIRRPMSKAELMLRVGTLLRTRSLSRDVVRAQHLYQTEHAVARRFQEAALPKTLPSRHGISMSAYYHAGHRDVLIGGDWYGAVRLDDGRLVLSVGDVCGSGVDAAVLMAHVRQVIRGVAHIHPDPEMMLDAVNRNLQSEYPDQIVTAFVGVLDEVTSAFEYVNAGHVPPLLRTPDGLVEPLGIGDLPLGIVLETPRRRTIAMPPGSVILLYTDGLVEYNRDVIEGQRRLQRTFLSISLDDDANAAKKLFSSIIAGEPPDDVAILMVRRHSDALPRHSWTFSSEDERAFADMRAQMAAALTQMGFDEDDRTKAEMVLAELVGNVLRHAPGRVEVIRDDNAGRPVLHVLDQGPTYSYTPHLPANVLSENGRGLYLVKQLTRDFNVSARPQGGSHARAVL